MDMPVVTASDFTAPHNQNIAASNLFSVTDANGDSIRNISYGTRTGDPASGHWNRERGRSRIKRRNRRHRGAAGQHTFQSGSGSDDLWVRANDGTAWGAWKEFHVNAPLDHAPVATASDFIATHNQNIAASSLFSATDADGDTITNYQFLGLDCGSCERSLVVGGVTKVPMSLLT